MRDRWEEKTVAEKSATPKPESVPGDNLDADSVAGTIDREVGAETIEEMTTNDGPRPTLASGSNELGLSTLDEPTVEDRARGRVPLSIVPAPDPDEGAPTRVAINGKLTIIGGNDRGREFTIDSARTTIGRGVDNDVILTDIAVSRRHLIIDFDGEGFIARDQKSGNGTLINNQLRETTRLATGDQLEIGNTLIRFECPQGAAQGRGRRATFVDDEDQSTVYGKPPQRSVLGSLPLSAGIENRVTGPVATPRAPLPPPARPALSMSRPVLPSREAFNASMTEPVRPMPMAQPGVLLAPTAGDRRRKLIIGAVAIAAFILLIAGAAALSGGDEPAPAASTTFGTAPTETAGDDTDDGAETPAPTPEATPLQPVATTTDDDDDDDDDDEATTAPVAASATEPDRTPTPEKAVAPPPAPAKARAPEKVAPKPTPKKTAPPKAPKKTVAKRTPKPTPKKTAPPKKTTPKRTSPRSSPRTRTATASQIGAAKRAALAQYKKKNFSAAAGELRDVAGRASESDKSKLESLADDYAAVGSNLDRARSTESSNPPSSMAAYRRALSIDKRAGKGQHATYIRTKLGEVAPKAAASFMAQKRYEAAKRACDAAVNYGAGSDPMVSRVRKALERKAGDFYKSAAKLRKSKPDQAKALLKRVLKIVPPDSPWYAKSYSALNKAKGPRDDDE